MRKLLQCRRGATAIEYGLIMAILAGALIVALSATSESLREGFKTASEGVAASIEPEPAS